MIYFKVRSARSWLASDFSRVLCAQLTRRLLARCRGERGLFLTLTYRRDEYADAYDLYRSAREERHVRRFIERFAAFLGESMTGRWLCKLEFQRGGWVHWHLLVLGVTYVDHAALTDLWGHGHVWVKRMTPGSIKYCCKYVSKDGQLPSFLYLEPMRSVRIIRVSPGFWPPDEDYHDDSSSHEKTQRLPAFVPIGEVIERSAQRCVCRDDVGRYCEVRMPAWDFLQRIKRAGGEVVAGVRGWLGVAGVTWSDVWHVRAGSDAAARRGGGIGGGGGRPGRPLPLHLKNGGEPPEPPRMSHYLHAYLSDTLGWREEISELAC